MLNLNLTIPGWKDPEGLIEIAKIVATLPDTAKIVEVGSGQGRLTYVFSQNCKGTVYAIDRWDGKSLNPNNSEWCYYCGPALKNTLPNFMKQMGQYENIIPIKASSPELEWNELVDMVFIDIDDQYELVKQNIEFWMQWLKPNGIIGGDDYAPITSENYLESHKETRKAVEDMAEKFNKRILTPGESNMWFYW